MARRWQNLPCPAGCNRGLRRERRPVQKTDRHGKKYTEVEEVDVPCGTCDSSGYVHVPGD